MSTPHRCGWKFLRLPVAASSTKASVSRKRVVSARSALPLQQPQAHFCVPGPPPCSYFGPARRRAPDRSLPGAPCDPRALSIHSRSKRSTISTVHAEGLHRRGGDGRPSSATICAHTATVLDRVRRIDPPGAADEAQRQLDDVRGGRGPMRPAPLPFHRVSAVFSWAPAMEMRNGSSSWIEPGSVSDGTACNSSTICLAQRVAVDAVPTFGLTPSGSSCAAPTQSRPMASSSSKISLERRPKRRRSERILSLSGREIVSEVADFLALELQRPADGQGRRKRRRRSDSIGSPHGGKRAVSVDDGRVPNQLAVDCIRPSDWLTTSPLPGAGREGFALRPPDSGRGWRPALPLPPAESADTQHRQQLHQLLGVDQPGFASISAIPGLL